MQNLRVVIVFLVSKIASVLGCYVWLKFHSFEYDWTSANNDFYYFVSKWTSSAVKRTALMQRWMNKKKLNTLMACFTQCRNNMIGINSWHVVTWNNGWINFNRLLRFKRGSFAGTSEQWLLHFILFLLLMPFKTTGQFAFCTDITVHVLIQPHLCC